MHKHSKPDALTLQMRYGFILLGESMRTVAYLRVSTTKQADHGVSLAAQRAKVEAYASLYDLELVEIIEDAGASAKSLDRDGLSRALDMLTTGEADGLLVVKLDRLTRSVRDLDSLISRFFSGDRWSLMSVGEQIDTRTAAGRLVLNVLAAVSQWEREAVGERTKAAMAHKKANREYTGGRVPYGWTLADDGVKLLVNEAEQAVMTYAHELRSTGLSLRAVGARLADRGMTPKRGAKWHATSVKALLAAPVAVAA